jgi:hypothetical protein
VQFLALEGRRRIADSSLVLPASLAGNLQLDAVVVVAAGDISADGKTIVRVGLSPEGHDPGWVARLDQPIFAPEPAAGVIMIGALVDTRAAKAGPSLGRRSSSPLAFSRWDGRESTGRAGGLCGAAAGGFGLERLQID